MTDETTPAPVPALPDFEAVAVPCTLHLKNGKTFIVNDVGGWGYVPQGVFASGHFKGYSGPADILINEDGIDYIELDFAALQRYLQSSESPST